MHNEDHEIELFEWCGLAIQSTSTSSHALATLKSRYQEQSETIAKLTAQLDDLISVKATHEYELLGKFRDLLNEKKSKIRDQQRVLASATVDPEKLAAVQVSSKARKGRAAGGSRIGKRKADAGKDATDSESGFERMDVDGPERADDTENEDMNTPDASDDETADEDDGDDEEHIAPVGRTTRHMSRSRQLQKGTRRARGRTGAKITPEIKHDDDHPDNDRARMKEVVKTQQKENEEQDSVVQAEQRAGRPDPKEDPPATPPRRELPFAKKTKTVSPAPAAAHESDSDPPDEVPADEGEETVSEDDLDDEL